MTYQANIDSSPTDGKVDADVDNDSVNTDEATIGGIEAGAGFEEGQAKTRHEGNVVSVSAGTFHQIFSVSPAVDVIGGSVYGVDASQLRITYGTGTTETIYSQNRARGSDSSGNVMSIVQVPTIRDVKSLEFYNTDTLSRDYGYRVVTE